jgi:transcriptional regulator with XRE-family HTH domain
MEWWERVRDLVEERSIRQVDLAADLGIQQGSVSNVINGRSKNARHRTIEAYAKALGVSVQWLITGQDADAAETGDQPADVFGVGERRFREWVSEREPQHAEKVPEFLRLLAERRFERWSAKTSALDVEEDLIKEFRAWRRGEWDEEPEGVPYVPAKRQR